MKPFKLINRATIIVCFMSSQAFADACDYRPSLYIGEGATSLMAGVTTATAAGGATLKAAGIYTLTHSVTGATMVGSTAAGASAAGTVGIIGGTSGVIGSAVAIITAPVTITAAAVTAVGVGAYEGVCYFQDGRITDVDEVRKIMLQIANHDETFSADDSNIYVQNEDGSTDTQYLMENL